MGIMGIKWTNERLNELRLETLAKRRQSYLDQYIIARDNNRRVSMEFYNEKIMEVDKLMSEIRAM